MHDWIEGRDDVVEESSTLAARKQREEEELVTRYAFLGHGPPRDLSPTKLYLLMAHSAMTSSGDECTDDPITFHTNETCGGHIRAKL